MAAISRTHRRGGVALLVRVGKGVLWIVALFYAYGTLAVFGLAHTSLKPPSFADYFSPMQCANTGLLPLGLIALASFIGLLVAVWNLLFG